MQSEMQSLWLHAGYYISLLIFLIIYIIHTILYLLQTGPQNNNIAIGTHYLLNISSVHKSIYYVGTHSKK